MSFRSSSRIAVASISLTCALTCVIAACGSAPKPPPPPPPAPVAVAPKPPPKEEKPPPPPPPKCEAMAEACMSDKATFARIAGAPLAFKPPSGWTYAQEGAQTIAQTNDEGPAIAVAAKKLADANDAKDTKKLDAARESLLDELGKRLTVTFPKAKIVWKKVDKTLTVGGVALSLYQREGGARGGKKGPLLVFTSQPSTDVLLVGVGFVPDDDTTNADGAILDAIQSIGPAPADAPTAASSPDDVFEKKTP